LGWRRVSIATPLFTVESHKVYADVISGQLFSNLSSSNDSGTSEASAYPMEDATHNVTFNITADSGIDVSAVNGRRYAVLAIPEEMQGLVAPNGTATFSTDILLPANALDPLLGVVDGAVGTLVNTIDGLLSANPLASVNLDEVYEQLDLLDNLSNITSAQVSVPLQTQGDGYIYAELDGALETVIRESLITILTDLNNAVQSLDATGIAGPVVDAALAATVKPVFATAIGTAEALSKRRIRLDWHAC
jgi:hypothetical protein